MNRKKLSYSSFVERKSKKMEIRNVAIIAHVDHGKTTLVDALLKQSGTFRENEHVDDRVMDSNDLEKERGITILAKNTSVTYGDYKINIIDTPGHADFGGEVERILSMVDGVLLLVDAIEGCMPQTRYVLKKALSLNKKALVVVNKVDRGVDPDELAEQILSLFIELGANEEQIEFKTIYASAKQGWATDDLSKPSSDMQPLLNAVIQEIPAPEGEIDEPLQLLICNIDYDEYIGKIGIGKVNRGQILSGQQVILCHKNEKFNTEKIVRLFTFEGLKRKETDFAKMGEFVMNMGCVNGKQLIDREYMEMATTARIATQSSNSYDPLCNSGYGYYTWITPDAFAFRGMGSQQCYCFKDKNFLFVCQADTQTVSDAAGMWIYDCVKHLVYDKIGRRKKEGKAYQQLQIALHNMQPPMYGKPHVDYEQEINGKTYTNVFYLKPGEAATFAEMVEFLRGLSE